MCDSKKNASLADCGITTKMKLIQRRTITTWLYIDWRRFCTVIYRQKTYSEQLTEQICKIRKTPNFTWFSNTDDDVKSLEFEVFNDIFLFTVIFVNHVAESARLSHNNRTNLERYWNNPSYICRKYLKSVSLNFCNCKYRDSIGEICR